MIDIISSSIRIGRYIRLKTEYKSIYDFYHEKDNADVILCAYRDLLKHHFNLYGFYTFDYVDKLVIANLESQEEIAQNIAKQIKDKIFSKKQYPYILKATQILGGIIAKYIGQLITNISTYPILELTPQTQKLQHISNELSTSILRSGVFSWLANPLKAKKVQQQFQFLQSYETATEILRRKAYPYNPNIIKYIRSLPKEKQEIAYLAENLKFLEFIINNAILQGFFFDLFDINENDVIKIKELNKQNAIHPIVIKTKKFFPDNHLMFFRFSTNEEIKYILAKKMTTHFSQDEFSTTLYGYTYPTNEYRLFTI